MMILERNSQTVLEIVKDAGMCVRSKVLVLKETKTQTI